MSRLYRNKLNEIRDLLNLKSNNEIRRQNNEKVNAEQLQKTPDREDQLLGEIELVTDPNDLSSEVKKNEINLGPIDTPEEVKAHGLDKKDHPEDEENDNSFSFRL